MDDLNNQEYEQLTWVGAKFKDFDQRFSLSFLYVSCLEFEEKILE